MLARRDPPRRLPPGPDQGPPPVAWTTWAVCLVFLDQAVDILWPVFLLFGTVWLLGVLVDSCG